MLISTDSAMALNTIERNPFPPHVFQNPDSRYIKYILKEPIAVWPARILENFTRLQVKRKRLIH